MLHEQCREQTFAADAATNHCRTEGKRDFAYIRVIAGNDTSATYCCQFGKLSGLTGKEAGNMSDPKQQQGFHETYPLAKIADRSFPAVRQRTGRTFICLKRSARGHLLRVNFDGKL